MVNRTTAIRAALAIAALIPVAPLHSQSHAEERAALLAADRKLGSNNATDAITAITSQFADSIVFISLGQIFQGIPAAREALGRNPDNAKSKATWVPLQGDVSADGKAGYTLGYISLVTADGKETAGKYVSYWVKEKGVWRVLVYKRAGRPLTAMATIEEPAPAKPAMKTVKNSAADSTRFAKELDAAERGFSDEAGIIGLGKAFTKNAAEDAHHVGGPTDAQFRRGPEEIGAGVTLGGEPPLGSLTWGPERVFVANSGDLGITYGYINIKALEGNPARRVSYLTIWKRDRVTDKWKLAVE